MIEIIFGILAGLLYGIGLLFGWTYEEASVYICIYMCPIVCDALAIYTAIRGFVKKKMRYAVVNGALSVLYLAITAVIFVHYIPMSIMAQFNDCMYTLQDWSKALGISYWAINLLIYVVLFFGIILFHIVQILFIDGKIERNGWRIKIVGDSKGFLNRILKIVIIVVGVCLLVSLIIYIQPLRLKKVSDRGSQGIVLNQSERAEIDKATASMSEKRAMRYAIRFTARKLEFSKRNNVASGNANCIGYAQYCAAVSNYISQRNNLSLRAKPVKGYVYWFGINVCDVLRGHVPKNYMGFVSDHDFVEFSTSDGTVYQDPCLYDLMGKTCKTKAK